LDLIKRRAIIFDILLDDKADEQEEYDIKQLLQEKFKSSFSELGMVVKSEPKLAYSTKT
jgi:hypothetical protein